MRAESRRTNVAGKGTRKVLGASAASIAGLLSKEFARLTLVAFALAAPVAYLVMGQWLEGFAYRVAIGPGLFLLAGGMALLVALFAVNYQAVKAALADRPEPAPRVSRTSEGRSGALAPERYPDRDRHGLLVAWQVLPFEPYTTMCCFHVVLLSLLCIAI